MNDPAPRSIEARAKVNLFLRVLGVRDDGYHDLETLIVPISLADRLEVHAAADPSFRTLSLSLDVTGEADLVQGVPRDESNLVLRAAMALAERAGVRGFADISLHKRVPAAAGLGGGSADAAAALLVLNERWGCGLDADELRRVGASVGSDVPALIMGGPVAVRGRGERVRPARCGSSTLAVVTFAFGVSTPDAFGWWDQEGTTGPDPAPLLDHAAAADHLADLAPMLFNDLEDPVVRRHPEIGEAKGILVDGGAAGAVMSGSGPTVVGVLPEGRSRLDEEAETKIRGLSGRSPLYVETATGR